MNITEFRRYQLGRLTRVQCYFLAIEIIASVGISDSYAADYYVSESGEHLPPFLNLENGATNIQDAVDLAGNGDTVWIGNGSYSLSIEIAVHNNILVKSINGPSQTTIDGGGGCRVFNLDDVDCVISGFTIVNGRAESDGGGVYCYNSSSRPVITNCLILGCSADYGGGIAGGTIYNSVIRGNSSSDAGGVFDATAYNCLIAGNMATNGGAGGALWSDLSGCTVADNTAVNNGGGVEGCNVANSIVYNNIAGASGDDMFDNGAVVSSCSTGTDHGVNGNITNSPSFIDLASGNFHLQPNSPCINAGDNSYVINAVDLDGNPRIVGVVDMGAYEEQSGAGDTDNDGMSDADEAIAGTDPNDDTSYFAITNWSPGSFTIEWPAFTNREYQVYRADSLTNTFDPVGPVIYFPQNSYTDSVPGVGGFYKVEVQLQ